MEQNEPKKNGSIASCLSRAQTVIGTDKDQSSTYAFLQSTVTIAYFVPFPR